MDIGKNWSFWVYPDTQQMDLGGIRITPALDSEALAWLEAGGDVLFTIPPTHVAPDPQRGRIAMGFSSIFWNTAWTLHQAPHTLGILCDPGHPALANFPTESHTNWQWWYLLSQAAPMLLKDLPENLKPIIHVIDDWFTCRKLALAIEARCGRGKLLITSIQLEGNCVARQLKNSLLNYMQGPDFRPASRLQISTLQRLFNAKSRILEA